MYFLIVNTTNIMKEENRTCDPSSWRWDRTRHSKSYVAVRWAIVVRIGTRNARPPSDVLVLSR